LLGGIRSAEEQSASTRAAANNLQVAISKIAQYSSTPEEDSLVENVKASVLSYLTSYQVLQKEGFQKSDLYQKMTSDYDKTQESIQALINLNLNQTKEIEDQLQSQTQLHNIFMAGALTLLVLLSGLLFWGFQELLTRPIFELKKSIDRFKLGSPLTSNSKIVATEIRDISSSFSALTERLSRQKDQQLTFLSSIAHDLKNPLGAIKLSAEFLAEEINEDQIEKKKILEIISRQTEHLRRLVDDLLDTTRVESGHFEIQPVPCDLRKLLDESISLHASLSKIHHFRKHFPGHPVLALADEQRILQVINNLLSNSIKYSPMGGPIDIELIEDRGFVSFSISDHGVGILPEDIAGIFEPFRRSSTSRNQIPGVGLGLSTTKKIIAAHNGGRIEVSSQPGKGSTFTVQLKAVENPRLAGITKETLYAGEIL
jgi:two-component system sensor histidine kinase MtrB